METSEKTEGLTLQDVIGERADERTTLETIVVQYSERVFNLALKILADRQDAEEATQDTFIRVFKSIANFRIDSTLSTWIYRIAFNVCLDRREREKDNVSSLDEMEWDPPDGRIADQSQHEKSLYDRESSELVERYISSLPPNESAVIALFYLDGQSYKEISVALKMPIGTVSVALHRGRKRLAEMLRKRKDDL